MLNISQFREFIIRPALDALVLYSPEAEELLVATCAQESIGGTYLAQEHGPAVGVYQMEPATHDDLWRTTLENNPGLRWKIMSGINVTSLPKADRMVWDLLYSTMMARVFYARVPAPLPKADDLDGIWDYYKAHWNTAAGAAKKDAFLENYHRFVGKR